MKKKNIFLSAMLLVAASTTSQAQFVIPTWVGGILTYTPYSVGVGTTSYPNDAWVHIFGNPSSTVKCPSTIPGSKGLVSDVFGKPELWIDRRVDHLLYTCASSAANLFQVSTTRPFPHATPRMLDVINSNGWLGVLKPNPLAPLHVGGDGIIDNDLTVGRDAFVKRHGRIQGRLQVNGGVIEMPQTSDTWRQFNGRSVVSGLTISANSDASNGSAIELYGTSNPGMPGQIHYIASGTGGNGHVFYNYSGGTWTHQVAITNDGRMVIGYNLITSAATPAGYKLYVDDGILTKKLKVAVPGTGNWSDFVFAADYNLMPLSDVESYIKANKHLPSVPSAEEVVADGIDMATMDAKLLQKVEELTLYVIEQQKQMTLQQKQIEEQNKKIELLTKQVNQ